MTTPPLLQTVAAKALPIQTVGTINLRNWLNDNIVPLLLLVVGIYILNHARKQDIGGGLTILIGACLGLGVIGIAMGGTTNVIDALKNLFM